MLTAVGAASAVKRSGCQAGAQEKLRFGSAAVPSFCTAARRVGSRHSACKIVGATCLVRTSAVTVCAAMAGFESSRPTWASSSANPPCSAHLLVLRE